MQEECFCGNREYRLVFEGDFKRWYDKYHYSLYKCKNCKLVRTYPVQDVSLYIEGAEIIGSSANGEYVVRDKPWMKPLALKMKQLLEEHPHLTGKPVLEIGCNAGEMVEEMNALGMDATGVDVDRDAIAYGQKRGARISILDVSEEELEAGRYGLIVMSHTLEHIPPAAKLIRNVNKALMPGGLLHIHVPNYAGLIPRLMGNNWEFLVPPQHTWQFTPETLQFNVERETDLRLYRVACKTNMEPNSVGIKGIVKRGVIAASIALNQGDEIVATFQKKTAGA